MKRITAVLLILLIALSYGCGRAPEPPPGSAAGESSKDAEDTLSDKEKAIKNNSAIDARDVEIIQFDDPDPGDAVAVISTTDGEIKVRLFERDAPKTAETFIGLVNDGFYNGQSFGTVVDGYKIECTAAADNAGHYPDEREFSLKLWNFRGAVSLSNNGSDFMIVQAPQCLNPIAELEELYFPKKVIELYIENGGAPHQDWENTVFGQVISGMEIVDKIAASPLDGEGGEPVNTVIITGIAIERAK